MSTFQQLSAYLFEDTFCSLSLSHMFEEQNNTKKVIAAQILSMFNLLPAKVSGSLKPWMLNVVFVK